MSLSHQWKVVIVAIAGTFMVILDQTIVNIALPHIMAVFNDTVDRAQFVISAYLMATAVSAPAAAFLSDRFGMKRVYLLSQASFLVGSVLCGLSWNTNSLILFRVIQGLAGGLLMPLVMTLIFTTVPSKERGFAMAIFGIPMMLAPAIGPTLGGYLVTDIDWRMVFYVNVPVVTVALFMGVAWIQESVTTVVSFDYRGFLLAAVGFSSLLLGLSYGPSWGWTDHGIVGFLLLGVISLATWVVVELRERIPMLDLRMFKYRGYSLATGLNFVTTLGLFSSVFLLPLFLQNLRGLSAFGAGLMLMPQALGAMVSMPISGRLYDKFGPRIPVLVGFLLMGFTTLWLYNLDTTTPDAAFRLNLFIRGLGMGFAMMPIMTFGLASVPVRLISQASSITNVSRTVFGSLGVAVFASILDTFHKANLATLAQTLTPDSLTTMRFLSNIQIILQQSGASFEEARQVATYALYQLANLRAFVMAFDDAFLISAMIVFIGLLPVLFLTHHRTEKGERGPVVIA